MPRHGLHLHHHSVRLLHLLLYFCGLLLEALQLSDDPIAATSHDESLTTSYLSLSRMRPFTSFRACNSDFSRCLRRNRNSPCSFSKSDLFSSTSGRSAFSTLRREGKVKGTVGSAHSVEALGLETASGDREVYKRDSRAEVGRELYGRVTSGQEYGEGRGQVDVLVSQSDENAPSRLLYLAVQHGIENGVVTLHVLWAESK